MEVTPPSPHTHYLHLCTVAFEPKPAKPFHSLVVQTDLEKPHPGGQG